MLELVHVEVALRQCRILARVVLEVLDLHVHALLLGLLGELHPLRIGGADHADHHRVVLGALR